MGLFASGETHHGRIEGEVRHKANGSQVTGAETDKVAANNIEMMAVEGSDIQIPADTRLAMVAILQQSVEVGDHILHICQVDKFLGDEDKKGLYAWNGFGKVAPAAEG